MFIQIFIRDTGTLKLYIPLHRSSTGYTYRPYAAAAAAAGAAVQSVKLYKLQEVSRISAPTLHWLHPQLGNVRCSNCCSLAPSHGAYLLHYVQLRQQPFDAVFELRQSSQRFWRLQLSCVVQPTLQNCGKKWAVRNCNSLTIKTGGKTPSVFRFQSIYIFNQIYWAYSTDCSHWLKTHQSALNRVKLTRSFPSLWSRLWFLRMSCGFILNQ